MRPHDIHKKTNTMKTQTNQMNKKGVLDLDMVGKVIVALLILSVISIAMFLALTTISSSSIISQTKTIGADGQQRFVNNTINLTNAGNIPAAVSGFSGVVLSSVIVTNASSGFLVPVGNYTVTGSTINASGAAGNPFVSNNVNVSATYTYTASSDTVNLVANVTNGTTGFFNNIPTIFTILGAVIIILAVTLILYAVSKFSNGPTSSL